MLSTVFFGSWGLHDLCQPVCQPNPSRAVKLCREMAGFVEVRKGKKKGRTQMNSAFKSWLRGRDLNPRPLGYEPNELPDCSTPRQGAGRNVCVRSDSRMYHAD